jgi:hypothetical protein
MGQKTHRLDCRRMEIVICISRMRNPTLMNREKNCQARFAAETRQSRDRQRIS